MSSCSQYPSKLPAHLLLTFFLLAAMIAPAGLVAAPAEPSAPPQETETLRLSSAPVSIVFPAGRGQWGRQIATFADAAARAFADILATAPGAGTLRWAPDPSRATEIDATVTVEQGGQGATITFADPFGVIAEDLGVSFAQGYARWLSAYSVARLYFVDAADPGAWWIDGAALYLTDLMARRERTTTPILYNFDGAYNRAARRGELLPLTSEGAAPPSQALRGKSLATFRLFEALYGEAAVTNLLAQAAGSPAVRDLRQTAIGNLPEDLTPSPGAVLDAWLQPDSSIDLALEDVRVDGNVVRGRVVRGGTVPTWAQVEVRMPNGELLYADIPAGLDTVEWEVAAVEQPVSVTLDPDDLLPDVNRSNNRVGFGNADRIREFFPLDDVIDIGELHLDGTIEQVGRKRVETFSVTLQNLGDEPLGLGLLVSAQWVDRPASRTQRRIFVMLPPGQQLVARDFIEYPRRGTGRARIEARYWQAPDPGELNNRLLRDPADLLNSYIVRREPAQATGPDGSPLERLEEEQPVASMAELTVIGAGEPVVPASNAGGPSGAGDSTAAGGQAAAPGAEPFGVRIVSPTESATPLGEMTFTVAVDGPDASLLELYVNDEVVGRGNGRGLRATFEATESQNVYLLRALAVGADGAVVTDSRVLQRGAIGFATSVDLVTLNITVRQPDGGFVENLSADDFVVVEDGVEQEIVGFSRGEDTAVFAAMLLDTSSSMIGGGIASARAGATRLVNALLRGNDRAMVLGFNERLYLYSDFSNDTAALHQAIEATNPDGGTSLYDALVGSLRKVNRRAGRRALIVLSDGLDVGSSFGFEDVLEYTRQSDVLVYTIGLQLMHDATELGDADDVVRAAVENLQVLAEATGGSAYFPLRLEELEDVYAQIADELESQYSISYYPTNQQWNGGWRELQVRVSTGAGRVQARPGYYGVRPGERR